MRGINAKFIDDLKTGPLEFFLREAKSNSDICLEIRANYLNLYYRGGSALKICQNIKGYTFHFDCKYCRNKGDEKYYSYLSSLDKKDPAAFVKAFPIILGEMDAWFACHPKPEREFQHNLIKNNQTQFTILDIEYAGWMSGHRMFRLDMIGIARTATGYSLVIFENKYGNGAIGGSAGLGKHYTDITGILANPKSKKELIESAVNIANNKKELGLLDLTLTADDITDNEIVFVLAGFNERSKSITNEVSSMDKKIPVRICFMNRDETVIDYSKAKDLFAHES